MKRATLLSRLCALLVCLPFALPNSSYDSHQEHNIDAWPRMVLPEHYLKEIRPPTLGRTPVLVHFNVFVVDINSINVEDMDFRVDMFIYQTWTESRLRIPLEIFEDDDDYVTLPPEFFDNLWQPDPYFLNSKVSEIATLNSKHSSVTLYKNKTVRYAARMHAIIACQMEFQFYPMDVQVCPMHIESFIKIDKAAKSAGPVSELALREKGFNGKAGRTKALFHSSASPIILAPMAQFSLEKYKRPNNIRRGTCTAATNAAHHPTAILIVCVFFINLVSYDSEKLSLRWGHEGVTVNPELKLLQYNLENPLKIDESVSLINEKNGNFSRLIVFFQFERQIGHHLIQTFAPSTLVVMLSWFSFWLGLDAIPGRVALLVTSMLTLVTMFTGLRSDIPPVAYVKALDLWMAGCMFFVFAALGEFVVVKVLDLEYQKECEASNAYRRLPPRLSVVEKSLSVWDYDSVYTPKSKNKRTGSRNLLQNTWLDQEVLMRRPKNRAKKIDTYSRIVFPVLFSLFTLLYWPILLFKKAQS